MVGEILRSVMKVTMQQCISAALQVSPPFKIQCKGVIGNVLMRVLSHPGHGN